MVGGRRVTDEATEQARLQRLEALEKRGTLVPGHLRAAGRQVLTGDGRHRNELFGRNRADTRQERAVLLLDLQEVRLIVADQIHLVHAHDHLPDA